MAGRSLVGERGLFEVWRKKSVHQQLAGEVLSLRAENVNLKREIQELRSDPASIERIAREELGPRARYRGRAVYARGGGLP